MRGFKLRFATEGQQLLGKTCSTLARFLNGFDRLQPRTVAGQLTGHQFTVAIDDRQQVIEVVSDPAGQAADGFHFLRLLKLSFEPFTFGDIADDTGVLPLILPLEFRNRQLDWENRSIFPLASSSRLPPESLAWLEIIKIEYHLQARLDTLRGLGFRSAHLLAPRGYIPRHRVRLGLPTG